MARKRAAGAAPNQAGKQPEPPPDVIDLPETQPAETMETPPAGKPIKFDEIVNKAVSPDLFYRITREYPDREATLCYVYRLWPRIDRKLSGPDNPNYIDVTKDPIDASILLKKWGAGTYQLFFVDSNRSRAQQRVCRTKVDLEDYSLDYPPVVDYSELVRGADRNRSYIQSLIARGILTAEGEPVKPHGGGTNPNELLDFAQRVQAMTGGAQTQSPGEGTVLNRTLDMMSKATDKVVDYALRRADASKAPPPADNAVLSLLAPMFQSTMQLNQTLMLKIMEMSSKQQPENSVETTLNLIDRLSDRFGIATGPKSGGGIVESIINALPGALNALAQMQAAGRAAGAGTLADPMNARTPQPQAPTQQPAAPTLPTPSAEAQAAGVSAEHYAQIKAVGEQMLKAMDAGHTGDDLANGIVVFYGPSFYGTIANLGKEGVLAALKLVPEVWARIQPIQPQADQFIQEFIDYGKPEPEPEPAKAE